MYVRHTRTFYRCIKVYFLLDSSDHLVVPLKEVLSKSSSASSFFFGLLPRPMKGSTKSGLLCAWEDNRFSWNGNRDLSRSLYLSTVVKVHHIMLTLVMVQVQPAAVVMQVAKTESLQPWAQHQK